MKKTMNREPSSETKVRFQDCDPLGHLNNARYLDYFINAREDHLADCYGLDIYDRQRQYSTSWVIAKTKIAYLNPSVFRERLMNCENKPARRISGKRRYPCLRAQKYLKPIMMTIVKKSANVTLMPQ